MERFLYTLVFYKNMSRDDLSEKRREAAEKTNVNFCVHCGSDEIRGIVAAEFVYSVECEDCGASYNVDTTMGSSRPPDKNV